MRKVAALFTFVLALSACTSSGGGGGAPTNGNFVYTSTGLCVDATTGQPAPSNQSCSSIPYNTSLFQLNTYGQCLDRTNNIVVDNRYCAAGAFSFQGLYCRDNIAARYVDIDYCIPANLPYYTDTTGACYFSTTHSLVGSNIPCQRLTNPMKAVCAGWYYSYYDGYWRPSYCSNDGSSCRGSLMFIQDWGVPVSCQ